MKIDHKGFEKCVLTVRAVYWSSEGSFHCVKPPNRSTGLSDVALFSIIFLPKSHAYRVTGADIDFDWHQRWSSESEKIPKRLFDTQVQLFPLSHLGY